MKLSFPPGDTFDPESVTWVTDNGDLAALRQAIRTSSLIVMDLETTGLNEHERVKITRKMRGRGKARAEVEIATGTDASIVLASITLPQPDDPDPLHPTTWLVPLFHPESPWSSIWVDVMTSVAKWVRAAKATLENHNVKFDCRWVKAHTGVDLTSKISWDPQIGAHLLDENHSTKLKEVVPRLIPGVERWDDYDLSESGAALRVPLEGLGMYAARDTYWTWRLGLLERELMYVDASEDEPPYFSEEIVNARLGRLMPWCAIPQCSALTSMEQRGIKLDVEWAENLRDEFNQSIPQLQNDLVEPYPELDRADMSFAPTATWFRLWAETAVAHGDLHIAAITKTGRPQWGKGVLTRQARGGSEVAEKLLNLRGASKRLEYLTSWLATRAPDDRIYANYNQGSVVTGRLSSSGPNMQQITYSLKPAFVPDPGFVIIDADFSQIELRIAAFISRCEPMIQAYRDGKDLHRMMAAQIINHQRRAEWVRIWGETALDEGSLILPEDVGDVERQAGKAANFGLLYGMGAFGFREYAETVYGVSFTLEEAHIVHAAFFDLWEGLRKWHIDTGTRASRDEQVTSPIGRIRRLPEINSADDKAASGAYRQAINAPVQGFASDMMQIAAAAVGGYMPRVPGIKGAQLLGTVHDSIFLQAPEDQWERVARQTQQYMVELVPRILKKMDCDFDVPLEAGVKVGTRYGLADVGAF